ARPTASPRRSPTASPPAASPEASASPSPSPSPAGNSTISVSIPPQCLVVLDNAGGGPFLQITNLRRALRPGDLAQIVLHFQFADGSEVVLGTNNDFDVPVALPTSALPRISPSLSPPEI
ncbi:MAG: hypothetical protein J2P15_23165, partial [Micromonosporaceae bacterium]|nr:hypothetical protein [Micromonosporaceae bacterium]